MDINILHETCKFLEDDLREMNAKVRANSGKLNNDMLSYIDKLTHAIKSIKSIEMAEQYDGYSECGYSREGMSYRGGRSYDGRSYNSYDGNDDYSGTRGRTGNVHRDAMGRYSRDSYGHDGYSRDDARDNMIMQLRDLMQNAEPHMKGEFQTFINKLERA